MQCKAIKGEAINITLCHDFMLREVGKAEETLIDFSLMSIFVCLSRIK